jgi:hypothetical protein
LGSPSLNDDGFTFWFDSPSLNDDGFIFSFFCLSLNNDGFTFWLGSLLLNNDGSTFCLVKQNQYLIWYFFADTIFKNRIMLTFKPVTKNQILLNNRPQISHSYSKPGITKVKRKNKLWSIILIQQT